MGQQFETITDAVKYIGRMTRTTERVTITLTDALYREQVMVILLMLLFQVKQAQQ